MSAIDPPEGLETAGKAVWDAVTAKYEFRPDEIVILDDVCRTADIIAAMESAWTADGRPMTTRGSMGQLVTHPLISELRQHRAARAKLLSQLKLPDDPSANGAGDRSAAARNAVNARWARRGA